MKIHLDGEIREIKEGSRLRDLLPDFREGFSVAIIKPAGIHESETASIRLLTTAGEIVVELNETADKLTGDAGFINLFSEPENVHPVRWSDRYGVSAGNFSAGIIPDKKHHRYAHNDVILGCAGYDPKKSFLILSKIPHFADHGSDVSGGVIGKIVSGKAVVEKLTVNDRIINAERIISRVDRSSSFTTQDMDLILEDGMEIISRIVIRASGYSDDNIDTRSANSVEHLLLTYSDGRFVNNLSAGAFIRDERMKKSIVPFEFKKTRLEGSVTVRTAGKQKGSIYIYKKSVASSPSHTHVGEVEHGIEIAKLAGMDEQFSVKVIPDQIDLRGMNLTEAKETALKYGISFSSDSEDEERAVTDQNPATTLEVLKEGSVEVKTVPLSSVLKIELWDENAPKTCEIFREVTGLKWYRIGKLPVTLNFEDVYLFSPKIPKTTKINIENNPSGEIPAYTLAMTNDSRKNSGLVGIRTAPNSDFGPTSEPFNATNVIGRLIDTDKLKFIEEGSRIYIMEEKSDAS
ncbi:methyl-coenzyme M reductase-associated protein Mmp3 [Methanoplanus limicola]|uniref:UPF0288 protein Metlim_1620 n=1 Tax=Methanoplanus limicola DSM 2279 TaxID=937775 RepID=H1Z442_9EURY|nr:methanogenesis marker 3 protein [Methanoplanus limicola]EHQ35721.1 UPF0288 protein [Methanoplanus limicola DSM 2279]